MNSILGSLTALALVLLIYGPWQHACTDMARQVMFRYRDQLFDLAMKGALSFDSPTYKALRRRIEMNIRFAHELTLPRLLFMIVHRKFTEGEIPDRANSAELGNISDPNTRAKVAKILSRSQMALIRMIVLKSPLAFVMLPFVVYPVIIYKINVRLYRVGARMLSKIIGVIQVEAEDADLNNGFSG